MANENSLMDLISSTVFQDDSLLPEENNTASDDTTAKDFVSPATSRDGRMPNAELIELLAAREKTVTLEKEIEIQRQEIEIQRQEIETQRQEIETQKQLINSQQNEIETLKQDHDSLTCTLKEQHAKEIAETKTKIWVNYSRLFCLSKFNYIFFKYQSVPMVVEQKDFTIAVTVFHIVTPDVNSCIGNPITKRVAEEKEKANGVNDIAKHKDIK